MLRALARALRGPGAVMLGACPAQDSWDPEGVRTVKLDPLRLEDIAALCTAWTGDADTRRLAAFLARITGGHPFTLHETIRWLEELGHVRIEEDAKRVTFLDPIERLPIPLFLRTVMETRYRRLSPSSAGLLHLLSRHDGRCEIETLRDLSGLSDDAFEEALAALRRRGFLLRRTSRHPLALASPLWRKIAREGPVIKRPRPTAPPGGDAAPHTRSVLAETLVALRTIRTAKIGAEKPAWSQGLAGVRRTVRHRPGPAWAGVRGRLAVLAARGRLEAGRIPAARLWIRWGLNRLETERHPAMRRELWRLEAVAAERAGRSRDARAARTAARNEALNAGHLLSATRLLAVAAEDRRREGSLAEAHADAGTAARDLSAMGLTAWAERAGYTAVSAMLDARDLGQARRDLESLPLSEAGAKEVRERLILLTQTPPLSVSPTPPLEGWGWGLDAGNGWGAAQRDLGALGARWKRKGGSDAGDGTPSRLDRALAGSAFRVTHADLAELVLLFVPSTAASREIERCLETAATRNRALGCPDRNRFLARALGPVHGDQPAFRRLLSGYLLEPVVPAAESAPPVRWRLLGRPRVETASREWPMALWPEWWLSLWTEVLAAALDGGPLSCEEAERLVRSAGDAPPGDLDAILYAGNQHLQNGGPATGGLERNGSEVRMRWGGLWCDAREILDALAVSPPASEDGARPGNAPSPWSRGRSCREWKATASPACACDCGTGWNGFSASGWRDRKGSPPISACAGSRD
jgi:hypothetical protein